MKSQKFAYNKFARNYELLRSRFEAGQIAADDREWAIAQATMERVCREEGGFKTGKWTYSWDHTSDRLRRLPTFKDSGPAPRKPPRIIKLPPHILRRVEVAQNRMDMAG